MVPYPLSLPNNSDLQIYKVIDFKLAPTVKVYTDQVTVKKDRELQFSGDVGAGLLQLSGNKFVYDYQNNTITPDDSTTMRMWYIDTLANGQIEYLPVATKMDNVCGVLSVNKANDKSNTLKTTAEYPKIETNKKAKIYYNNFLEEFTESTGGADKFYFEADNFNFDVTTSGTTEETPVTAPAARLTAEREKEPETE
jgi:hypothetical protein